MAPGREEPPRAPQQERAKKRVEDILAAARVLILEKGSAGMKMGDIAATAGVTAGSIYQYFPNKRAIIHALARQYLDTSRQTVETALAEPLQSLDDLATRVDAMIDDYYHEVRRDPVVRELWTGFAADKELQAMEAQDTEAMATLLFERSKHLFRRGRHPRVRTALRLLIEFVGSAIALAISQPETEARRIMNTLHSMLLASWEATVLPHATAAARS